MLCIQPYSVGLKTLRCMEMNTTSTRVVDLSKQIFFGDLRGDINAHRQRLQTMYVEELLYILNNKDYIYSSTAEAVAHQNLRNIPRLASPQWWWRYRSKRHRQYLRQMLQLPFGQLNAQTT